MQNIPQKLKFQKKIQMIILHTLYFLTVGKLYNKIT